MDFLLSFESSLVHFVLDVCGAGQSPSTFIPSDAGSNPSFITRVIASTISKFGNGLIFGLLLYLNLPSNMFTVLSVFFATETP